MAPLIELTDQLRSVLRHRRDDYYKAAAAGEIKMVAIRNRGAVRGVRLVAYDSVVDYVRRSMNAVKPASRHEPPPQPVAGQLGLFGSADPCAKPATY